MTSENKEIRAKSVTTRPLTFVKIERSGAKKFLWLESVTAGDDLMAAVEKIGATKTENYTITYYKEVAEGRIYSVTHANEDPKRRWISDVYQKLSLEERGNCETRAL